MKKLKFIQVEFIPELENMKNNTIYMSEKHSISAHKCLCGCGNEVVMPFNNNHGGWRMIRRNGKVSFNPSVGNWEFPCRSHYWIENGCFRWNWDEPPIANLNLPLNEKVKRIWIKIKKILP